MKERLITPLFQTVGKIFVCSLFYYEKQNLQFKKVFFMNIKYNTMISDRCFRIDYGYM